MSPERRASSPSGRSGLSEVEIRLGQRLARLRRANGLTLAQLGELTGLSEAYLSRVENFKAAVTVASVARLAEAFDMQVGDLFDEGVAEPRVTLCRAGGGKRVRFRGRDGVRVRLLAAEKRRKLMEPIFVDLSTASLEQPLLSHGGQEFVYVVEGACRFVYGTEEFLLEQGDALFFDATVAHAAFQVKGKRGAMIAVVTSEDFRFHNDIVRLMEADPNDTGRNGQMAKGKRARGRKRHD